MRRSGEGPQKCAKFLLIPCVFFFSSTPTFISSTHFLVLFFYSFALLWLFSSFLFYQKSFFWPPFLLFWKSRWMGGEEGVVVKCGREECGWEEVWMTTAIDLKSPLEYFFWASLSYEPLSYEPNISVWVSFWYMVRQCRISTAVWVSCSSVGTVQQCGYRAAVKNISCSGEVFSHSCTCVLTLLHPAWKKSKNMVIYYR